MRTNSLASRFLLISTLWSVFALVIAALLLTTLYKGNAERNFEELLNAHLYNLMGAVDLDKDRQLTGTPNLGAPFFKQPWSGWYWSVVPKSSGGSAAGKSSLLRSPSMVDSELKTPSTAEVPFKNGFSRTFKMPGLQGEELLAVEAQIFLGEGDDVFRFIVAGNYNVLTAEIDEFSNSLLVFLAIFGVGMIASTFLIIKLGMRPLDHAKKALNEVRQGRAERLEGDFPEEISPLVNEVNALIESNKSVLERARTQVGNLAHALKTPISVLKNEVNSPGGNLSKTVEEQADRMQEQVQRYLDRARIAAQSGSIYTRTPLTPVVERMVRVMQRLNPQLEIALENDAVNSDFKGEQQDLEEVLGNLLENACNYARARVRIQVSTGRTGQSLILQFCIEDDGHGLSEKQREDALKRGKRLDETRPGSGLGLSIVNDIINEYQGSIELSDGSMGGLKVLVKLPAATN